MEFRKVFDLIPGEFDRWRPQYCPEAFADIIQYADLNPRKKVLEIGPGTGQATKPLLMTGCDYVGIELGEHLYEIVEKRIAAKEECFRQLHTEIIPMLLTLKNKGFTVGLISNCFSEEAEVIRRSELFGVVTFHHFSYLDQAKP